MKHKIGSFSITGRLIIIIIILPIIIAFKPVQSDGFVEFIDHFCVGKLEAVAFVASNIFWWIELADDKKLQERAYYGKVVTVIENTGSPIPENDLSRVWDQFYRVEHSRDRKSGGTGLGLAIVKHIMELHYSEFGNKGVAFSFTLYESRGEPHEY